MVSLEDFVHTDSNDFSALISHRFQSIDTVSQHPSWLQLAGHAYHAFSCCHFDGCDRLFGSHDATTHENVWGEYKDESRGRFRPDPLTSTDPLTFGDPLTFPSTLHSAASTNAEHKLS